MPLSFSSSWPADRRPHCLLLVATLLVGIALALDPVAATAKPRAATDKPTIVLVHGAFADASRFGGVTNRLQDAGYDVLAPAGPLRGLASDAAYVASVLKTIKGPIVLVGHSYGGAVITAAATQVATVKALVYLNAFALAQGESAAAISERFTNNELASALLPRPFPQADGSEGTDLYIDPAKFRSAFAADVPARLAARMAAAQRPVTVAAFIEPLAVEPAWKPFPRGTWSARGTRPSIRPQSGSWPGGPARTPSRSARPTCPTSRTRPP
jgi:pimeloyl-ACP methyl ester carboxylesterase